MQTGRQSSRGLLYRKPCPHVFVSEAGLQKFREIFAETYCKRLKFRATRRKLSRINPKKSCQDIIIKLSKLKTKDKES